MAMRLPAVCCRLRRAVIGRICTLFACYIRYDVIFLSLCYIVFSIILTLYVVSGAAWHNGWRAASGDGCGQNTFPHKASPASFQVSGSATLATLAKFLQARFPGSKAFHRRVADFRPRAAVYTTFHSYTYASPLCLCVCLSVDPT